MVVAVTRKKRTSWKATSTMAARSSSSTVSTFLRERVNSAAASSSSSGSMNVASRSSGGSRGWVRDLRGSRGCRRRGAAVVFRGLRGGVEMMVGWFAASVVSASVLAWSSSSSSSRKKRSSRVTGSGDFLGVGFLGAYAWNWNGEGGLVGSSYSNSEPEEGSGCLLLGGRERVIGGRGGAGVVEGLVTCGWEGGGGFGGFRGLGFVEAGEVGDSGPGDVGAGGAARSSSRSSPRARAARMTSVLRPR